MTQYIALLHGINIGRTKRIPMTNLRGLFEGLGFSDVRTLLNSGNVVFHASQSDVGKLASAIEAAIRSYFGFSVPVSVLTALELNTVVAENPLLQAAGEPSKLLVGFIATTPNLGKARQLLMEAWAPDALAVGDKAAYLWCPHGIIKSRLMQAFTRIMGDAATTRNWATVLNLQAVVGERQKAV